MFGIRRRKADEENEPLVPHGLIWHATAEPESKSLEPAVPSKYAEIIVLTPRAEAQKQQTFDPAATVAELLARQGVPPKPIPPVAPIAPIKAESTTFLGAPGNSVEPVQQDSEQHSISGIQKSAPVPLVGRRRETFKRALVWLQTSRTTTRQNALSFYSKARQSWLLAFRLVDIKKELLRARAFAKTKAGSGIQLSRRSAQKTRSVLSNVGRFRLVPASYSVRERAHNFSARARRVCGSLMARQFRLSSVRTILFGLPVRARILVARKLSGWEMRYGQALDDRLWTSMTLAAICAILALVIVSVVPHYASKALPSRIFGSTATVSADTTPAIKPGVQPESEKSSSNIAAPTVAITSAVGSSATSPSSGKLVDAAAHPKHGHDGDDDYVAPDTYKYYGNSSSDSRH